MAKPHPVISPEEHRKQQEAYARLSASTDAAISAALDVFKRNGDDDELEQAMKEASERVDPPRGRLPEGMPDLSGLAPEDHPRLSGEGWTVEKQRAFLVHLSETGCVGDACAPVGLSRQSAYKLRRRAPNSLFSIGWDVAIHMARQAMLDEATERAIQGREVPVWYQGQQVGTRILHNDRLLMFLLACRRDALHPALDAREMTHLFPTMLRMVDTILPPAFTAERIAELTGHDGAAKP
ncbi:hypothetical protein [Sphingomonas sp. G-3-2-10]|uniref:hypothetical protein n=1 Tax=Sphingomonas sp. G-3-2-10 TaxID=2728838 RepID=UPI00146D6D1F|nr:hypothetical protein [Sphingomonas sp. G-3-2-10]NML06175.1 hypothetical protein [Sphingomonas sp. G-3-2-10]